MYFYFLIVINKLKNQLVNPSALYYIIYHIIIIIIASRDPPSATRPNTISSR